MHRSSSRGFTLVELAVTILIIGMIFAFSIPAYRSISSTYQLKGATENLAGQLRLCREKAIATGEPQPMHFTYNWTFLGVTSDYHLHLASGAVPSSWKLPRGVTYYSVTVNPTMLTDGRASASGEVVLQDQRGLRDTVSVQMSGLILTK